MIDKYCSKDLAIVVIAYNRIDSLERLLNSVNNAVYPSNDINLIVSIDYSEKIDSVKKYVDSFNWKHGKKTIRSYDMNQGLKKHVLSCGDLTHRFGACIILEDDLFVSKDFYLYALSAINYYDNNNKIAGIALYSHGWNGYANYKFSPIKTHFTNYFGSFSITWGQVWTEKQWSRFQEWCKKNENKDFDDYYLPKTVKSWGVQSWGKIFFQYITESDLFYVIPYISRSTNFNEKGVHTLFRSSVHQVPILTDIPMSYDFSPLDESSIIYDGYFERVFLKEINGINPREICVNLNGIKSKFGDKKYLLTFKKYRLPVISSYGMTMSPIDANIDNNIIGNSVYLYEIKNKEFDDSKFVFLYKLKRFSYEIEGYSSKFMIVHLIYKFIKKIYLIFHV